ncbi:hypothetical protein [Pontibacter sp. G13]|uniref:hypothetical protein n=1 Tax=Pontibacter sp. G13 TaxID=3074898 RepID=UPI00288B5300|nr:hypothetical protein [Pontibacter sp. G13]WNJ17207.1 hypothetical protein RJD25_20315 [Pontibacter sp. G13]
MMGKLICSIDITVIKTRALLFWAVVILVLGGSCNDTKSDFKGYISQNEIEDIRSFLASSDFSSITGWVLSCDEGILAYRISGINTDSINFVTNRNHEVSKTFSNFVSNLTASTRLSICKEMDSDSNNSYQVSFDIAMFCAKNQNTSDPFLCNEIHNRMESVDDRCVISIVCDPQSPDYGIFSTKIRSLELRDSSDGRSLICSKSQMSNTLRNHTERELKEIGILVKGLKLNVLY